MPKPDAAHRATDDELAKLERRIARLYREAADELQETIETYFEKFKKRDEEMKALIGTVQNGKEWTEQDYKLWRLNQIGRGRRYEALREKIAQRMTNAHETAIAYVNDATPGIYSLNRNYAAYTIERVAGNVDFTLWDEQTVRRLIVEQPDLMPYYPKAAAVKRGIDLEYGKKQITKCVTSSILQGKSIKGISDDLQRYIPTMSRDSAIRAARTAVTGAQNAGRQDSYVAAEKRGIELKKEWVATLDNRTRHAHAMLDGQKVGANEPFKVDGYKLMFPGDRSAPGYLIYNCRCAMVAVVDGVDTSDAMRRARDPETGESVLIRNVTYKEWKSAKHAVSRASDVTHQYRENAKPKTGKIHYENGYKQGSHKREISVASHLWKQFGGDITLLKESDVSGEKTPDYLWRGKLWELKSISTSKAADMAIRKGIKQIAENSGGIILQCSPNIDITELIYVVDDRAIRSVQSTNLRFDVIALGEDGTLQFARRYKK